ncbi:30S ribosomal protein S5 [bacterium]|nr:30S ribosomal protein S5 [bacterium]NBX49376.1 30S ribosomal protein S5 [bacterium]
MAEQENIQNAVPATQAAAPQAGGFQRGNDRRGGRGQGGQRGGGRGDRRGGRSQERDPREFEQKTLELSRVTRVTKGGKRMRFRATVVVGDKKGRVGFGVAKGADVAMALDKASRQAKKRLVQVPLLKGTIPHEVAAKFGAAMVIIKPAPQGTGLKSGGPARIMLELAGVPNAVSKILGGKNKINNVKAAFAALKMLRKEKASTPSA